jgi:hypothetical protein
MKDKKKKYTLLIHCQLHQIREGFEEYLNFLPFPTSVHYADLKEEGIQSKLRFNPHIIIILLNEADSDFLLPFKVKLFASEIPLLIISPGFPKSYKCYLEEIGVDKIIELPIGKDIVCQAIEKMIY